MHDTVILKYRIKHEPPYLHMHIATQAHMAHRNVIMQGSSTDTAFRGLPGRPINPASNTFQFRCDGLYGIRFVIIIGTKVVLTPGNPKL